MNSPSGCPALGPSHSHYSRPTLCSLLSSKQAKAGALTLRPGLTFALPPITLWWFQQGLEFSEEPKARAGLGWVDHPSTRSSTAEQRWNVRVSSYPVSQVL